MALRINIKNLHSETSTKKTLKSHFGNGIQRFPVHISPPFVQLFGINDHM